jgi:hypothetical protein
MNPFRPRMPGNSPPIPPGRGPARPAAQPQEQFQSLRASSLYCPHCRQETPVRERLLLVLPDGNIYEYRCVHCGTSTGSKTEKEQVNMRILL